MWCHILTAYVNILPIQLKIRDQLLSFPDGNCVSNNTK